MSSGAIRRSLVHLHNLGMGFPKILAVIWSFIKVVFRFLFVFEAVNNVEQDGPPQSAPLSAVILSRSINRMSKDDIEYVERELSYPQLVSLSFLLFGDDGNNRLVVQEMLNGSEEDRKILQFFADRREAWQKPMLEALAIIKANKILRKWGFDAQQLKDIFLPHNPSLSVHINPILKVLYYLADNLELLESAKLISFVNKNYDYSSESKSDDPMFLEISMLNWISKSILKVGVWHENSVAGEVNIDVLIRYLKENHFIVFEETLIQSVTKFISSKNARPTNITTDRLNSLNDEHTSIVSQISHEYGITNIKKHYPVTKHRAGIILIINQEDFTWEQNPRLQHLLSNEVLKKRTGTNKDRDALKDVFEPHGYKPYVIQNEDHKIVQKTIKEVVSSSIDYDSLIVCILSHGADGVVFAANSIPMEIKEIEEIIMAGRGLLGKPKILIIQACRGSELQRAKQIPVNDKLRGGYVSAASYCDYLILQSTVDGFASVRHRDQGTWFIQTLCKCIKEYGNIMHLEKMFTSVIRELSERRCVDGVSCMVPQKMSTLRYYFYLPKK